ncbi:hypothetical protein [Bradyrhizobium sp. USDA 4502]
MVVPRWLVGPIVAFTLGFALGGSVFWGLYGPNTTIERVSQASEHSSTDHEPKSKKEETDEALARYTLWLMIFTGILAVATIGLGGATLGLYFTGEKQIAVSRRSAEAAIKSAKVADEALFMGNRPYIFVTKAELNHTLDPATFDFAGAPLWPTVDYMVENHGSTPATIMLVCADSACVAALPGKPEYRPETAYRSNRMILPGKKGIRLTYPLKTPIDGQVLNDIRVGTVMGGRSLYAYGFIKFEDIFGNINEIGFCWRYMPGRNFYPEDNDAYNYHYVYRPAPSGTDVPPQSA